MAKMQHRGPGGPRFDHDRARTGRLDAEREQYEQAIAAILRTGDPPPVRLDDHGGMPAPLRELVEALGGDPRAVLWDLHERLRRLEAPELVDDPDDDGARRWLREARATADTLARQLHRAGRADIAANTIASIEAAIVQSDLAQTLARADAEDHRAPRTADRVRVWLLPLVERLVAPGLDAPQARRLVARIVVDADRCWESDPCPTFAEDYRRVRALPEVSAERRTILDGRDLGAKELADRLRKVAARA